MTRKGGENVDHEGVRTKRRAGGVQLPMELSFITVNQPGERIPYTQLSQITAHAMRRTHERRRGLDASVTQPQSQHDDLQLQRGASPGISKHKHHSNRKDRVVEVLWQQSASNYAAKTHTNSQPLTLGQSQTPPSPESPQEIVPHVIHQARDRAAHCACSPCQTYALIRQSYSASADMVFGGTRTDPFLRYPIPFQDYFPAAVDICKEVICPNASFFELVMTHEVLFEALLSWILCTTLAQTPKLKKAMLSHYGNNLSKVRELLASQGTTRRAVMAAISNLAGVCAYIGDDDSFNTHRTALEYLAEVNDSEALPSLDLTPRRRTKLYDALSTAQPWSDEDASLLDGDTTLESKIPIYPKLPFPEALCRRIKRLPKGLAELAWKRILSVQVIERVSMSRGQVVVLASRATMDREYFKALRQNLTALERMIWLAFSVFHLCTATYKVDREELAEAFVECSIQMVEASKAEVDCLLWGGCMVATMQAVEDWDLPRRQEAMEILLSRFKLSVEEMNAVAQKFRWNEALSSDLEEVVRRRTITLPKSAEGSRWPIFL